MNMLETFRNAADQGFVAPYTFVRIEPHVMPAPTAALDLGRPLPDGLCGELEVRWSVETPVLVGGREGENNRPFTVGGRLAIPGASLRGLTRAVLEVAAYARVHDFIADRYFGIRDFEHPSWKNRTRQPPAAYGRVHYPGNTPIRVPGLGAWLIPDPNRPKRWLFQPCRMALVPVIELVRQIGGGLTEAGWHNLSVADKRKELPANLDGVFALATLRSVLDPATGRPLPGRQVLPGRRGTLAVTGRWESWDNGTRDKRYEAVFLEPTDDDPAPAPVAMSEEMFKRFDTAEPDESNQRGGTPARTLWRYWQEELRDGRATRVPVFYEGDPALAASEQEPAPAEFYFSLTRFMRVPHRYSVAAVARQTQPDPRPQSLDLAQSLFGHVPPEGTENPTPTPTERAWRSRVFFADARLDDGQQHVEEEKQAETMAPKPSFYPYYLRPRDGARSVKHPLDWSNGDTVLAGRKRYVPRGTPRPFPTPQRTEEQRGRLENSLVFARNRRRGEPLTFTSRVRFHNLSPVELGAVVWALTLGEHGAGTARRRHMLGRAKAYGYGQTLTRIVGERVTANTGAAPSLADCLAAFEKAVADWHSAKRSYRELDQIRDLLAITDLQQGLKLSQYLRLPRGTPTNDADATVAGYVALRQKTYDWRRSNGTSNTVPTGAAPDRFILPRYPWTDES